MPLEKRTRVEIFLPIRSDTVTHRTVTEWLAEELRNRYAIGTLGPVVSLVDVEQDTGGQGHHHRVKHSVDCVGRDEVSKHSNAGGVQQS